MAVRNFVGITLWPILCPIKDLAPGVCEITQTVLYPLHWRSLLITGLEFARARCSSHLALLLLVGYIHHSDGILAS